MTEHRMDIDVSDPSFDYGERSAIEQGVCRLWVMDYQGKPVYIEGSFEFAPSPQDVEGLYAARNDLRRVFGLSRKQDPAYGKPAGA